MMLYKMLQNIRLQRYTQRLAPAWPSLSSSSD